MTQTPEERVPARKKTPLRPRRPRAKAEPAPRARRLAIAGIGASAGGVEALQSFFHALPPDLGVAYVVVIHLSPEHHSELANIIARHTKMPVMEVHETATLRPDRVYVIPPDRRLEIVDGSISARPFEEPRGKRSAVDLFFRSLAGAPYDSYAIILSGSGTDGALGAKAAKEAGGIVLVQDPQDASHDGMPRAVIATGVADIVLPVGELAARFARLVHGEFRIAPPLADVEPLDEAEENALLQVLQLIRARTGQDFTKYKRTTMMRRIQRRMQLQGRARLAEYVEVVRNDAAEATALVNDLLISVTNFFRDAPAWKALEQQVIDPLFDGRPVDRPLRAWVAGCATGEEAYSLAILFHERLSRAGRPVDIVIFASDVDESALAIAREGLYPASISEDLSAERLQRFFRREGNRYRVTRQLRECVNFATHNLMRDPPFSGLDLVTCRNLLIYLNREMQEQVCAVLRYACGSGGYLLLGQSETVDAAQFRAIDKEQRIYQVREAIGGRPLPPPEMLVSGPRLPSGARGAAAPASHAMAAAAMHREALEKLAPPSVLVDDRRNVVHLSGTAGRFLQPPGGLLASDITQLVRQELQLELRARLNRAFDKGETGLSPFIPVRFDDATRRVAVLVAPQGRSKGREQYTLVVFLDGGAAAAPDGSVGEESIPGAAMGALREEVRDLEERMATARDEQNVANEELRAANEELQSLNEEYRSTAEELETSKEELQSINEELQTVNAELKSKLEEVSRAHDDLENLMAATEIGTLFLDHDLRIYRFTPRLAELFNIKRSDGGRSITDFKHQLDYDELAKDAEHVLATLLPLERRARTRSGQTYLVRIRPYRTVHNVIDGVVVTFVDVTALTAAEQKLRESERQLAEELAVSRRLHEMMSQVVAAGSSRQALNEIVTVATVLQAADFGTLQLVSEKPDVLEMVAQVGFASSFVDKFRTMTADDTTPSGQTVRSRQRVIVEDVVGEPVYAGYQAAALEAGYRGVHSIPLINDNGTMIGVLSTYFRVPRTIAERDKRALDTLGRQAANLITRLRGEEDLLRMNRVLARQSAELRDEDSRKAEFLALLGHELRNPLAAVRGAIAVLTGHGVRGGAAATGEDARRMIEIVDRQSLHITRMVNDLLDLTRIKHGKIELHCKPVAVQESVDQVVDSLRPQLEDQNFKLELQLPTEPLFVNADRDRLMQIIDNVLSNALHHSSSAGTIQLSAQRLPGHAEIRVRDYGEGIAAEDLQTLFEPFFQGSNQRRSGGLGLGLTLVQKLVALHGGEVEARSEGLGKGSEFVIRLPLRERRREAPRTEGAAAQALRVLVVDDQPDVADAIGSLLKSLGHDVRVAQDGDSAMQVARSFRPEVALVDLSMPNIDGYELGRRLREEFEESALTLIAITGHSRGDLEPRTRQAGFRQLLSKPLESDLLAGLLSTVRRADA